MPEIIPVSDEEYGSFMKSLRVWMYIVLASSLLFVISMSLAYFEPGNTVIVDILLILQLGIFVVAFLSFLKNRKFIKELRSRARNT